MIAWYELVKNKRIVHSFFKFKSEFNMDEFMKVLNDKVKLICIPFVSNCSGTVIPVKSIAEKCHEKGVKVLVDAGYGAGHKKVDVREWNADFVLLSPKNLCGPEGINILCMRQVCSFLSNEKMA